MLRVSNDGLTYCNPSSADVRFVDVADSNSEEEYVEHEKERIRQAELEGYGYTNIKFRIKITRDYKTRKHGMESYF